MPRPDYLDLYVIGTGVEMPAEARCNGLDIAVDGKLVDKPVATITGQIVVGEPEPAQVVCVVHQSEIGMLDPWASERPRAVGLTVHNDLLLGCNQQTRPQNASGATRVLGRH